MGDFIQLRLLRRLQNREKRRSILLSTTQNIVTLFGFDHR